ncbi:MAG TPA: class I SAM-dependent methyltransferase [Burkholderiales bacterium]|nr:class I SAM-dependent methyltransferase [Burkholderiales bacterium]
MSAMGRLARASLVLVLAASGACATDYEPQVGQAGKDVVWVPTPQALVDTMLDMAGVTPADTVIDLGSGDGRTVITAAKRGARAIGIEYNRQMVDHARRAAEREGVSGRAQFVHGDVFETNFSHATVLTLFLLPQLNLKLRPQILAMKPGTRVVSNSFTMGDWQPDDSTEGRDIPGCDGWCTALMWIVPAKVEGTWQTPHGEVLLRQEYQKLSGVVSTDGRLVPLEGQVRGEEISFTAGKREYRGRLRDGKLELR